MTFDYALLAHLSEAPGIPGREEIVRAHVEDAVDAMGRSGTVDALGNYIVTVEGPPGRPAVMVSAHMDEIGFVVKHVDDEGFLRVHPLGGFDVRTLFARQVVVHARRGEPRIGILHPGVKPIHVATPEDRKKVPEMADFTVDLGIDADTVKHDVRVGDMVTLLQPFRDLGPTVTGKALDDRVGVWILLHTLSALRAPTCTVHAVFSVQEEVGLRGATTGAFGLAPDVGIALDTTLAIDTPGTPAHQSVTKMGAGVGIKVSDSSMISNGWLVDAMARLAEEQGIAHQFEVLPLGGTDAGAIQRSRSGVPSVTLSTPSRYVHTVTEMVSKRDLEAGVRLLTAFLEDDTAALRPQRKG